jgi:hypothetical protein
MALASCKKTKVDPHVPPDVSLKTGGIYTSDNKTVKKSDTLTVGLIATKTEDDLKSYNISVRFDASSTSNTTFNYLMTSAEIDRYEHDHQLIARAQTGTETWLFSIVDRDGNITQKTIVLTVQ